MESAEREINLNFYLKKFDKKYECIKCGEFRDIGTKTTIGFGCYGCLYERNLNIFSDKELNELITILKIRRIIKPLTESLLIREKRF